MRPYGDVAAHQAVGADHAGVADVDHVRVVGVQPAAEADQEDGGPASSQTGRLPVQAGRRGTPRRPIQTRRTSR